LRFSSELSKPWLLWTTQKGLHIFQRENDLMSAFLA
jgi:hypothetical protein